MPSIYNPPAIFGDFSLGAAITIMVAIIIPLGLFYSDSGRGRRRVHPAVEIPLAFICVLSAAMIVAAIDSRALHRMNTWDIFLISVLLMGVVSAIGIRRLNRVTTAQDDASSSSMPDSNFAPSGVPEKQPSQLLGPERVMQVCSSSAEYASAVIEIERGAGRVDRMAKRVSAIFKDPLEVQSIAERRFGPGSRQASAYLAEHRERHRIFVEKLAAGDLVCREIYHLEELRRYFRTRTHGTDLILEKDLLKRTAAEWLRALQTYPGYFVGLTLDPIPIKYQLYDQNILVIHEAAGSLDGQRVNSLIIRGQPEIDAFSRDFDQVWERIPAEMRSRFTVIKWIQDYLFPMLDESSPISPETRLGQ